MVLSYNHGNLIPVGGNSNWSYAIEKSPLVTTYTFDCPVARRRNRTSLLTQTRTTPSSSPINSPAMMQRTLLT